MITVTMLYGDGPIEIATISSEPLYFIHWHFNLSLDFPGKLPSLSHVTSQTLFEGNPLLLSDR